jgi:hypothetical protein
MPPVSWLATPFRSSMGDDKTLGVHDARAGSAASRQGITVMTLSTLLLQKVVIWRLSSPSPNAFSVLQQSWRVLPLRDDAFSARTELCRWL